MTDALCRNCRAPLRDLFIDLGETPLANSYLLERELALPERQFPLKAYVCRDCYLVQLEEYARPESIFSDYAYFSSVSTSWVEHAYRFATFAIDEFGLTRHSSVIEVASNDGYLLRHFVDRGIPVLGIEPAANVASVAQRAGIDTLVEFFGESLAAVLRANRGAADLIVCNNVVAHVPDLHDFIGGVKKLLAPNGVVSIEVPHLLNLIRFNQFDTIYHEHFSYFSLATLMNLLSRHGLEVFDVQLLATHGGSLRVFCRHWGVSGRRSSQPEAILAEERAASLDSLVGYLGFAAGAASTIRELHRFVGEAHQNGKTLVGYGAPAKGNTLLNAGGFTVKHLPFTVDRNPRKQGRYLPGSHIPIREPEAILEVRPDYVLVLPWNLIDEIEQEMAQIRDWGGQFVTVIPQLRVRA